MLNDFLDTNRGKRMLFLELGVGFTTPGIIRYEFEFLLKLCITRSSRGVMVFLKHLPCPLLYAKLVDKTRNIQGKTGKVYDQPAGPYELLAWDDVGEEVKGWLRAQRKRLESTASRTFWRKRLTNCPKPCKDSDR